MAFLNVTTGIGITDYGAVVADANIGVYIYRNSPPSVNIRRIGYAWFLQVDSPPSTNQHVFARFPVYLPGTNFTPALNYSMAGSLFRLVVDWDIAGIPITIYY